MTDNYSVKETISERINYLNNLCEFLEGRIRNAPSGHLRISTQRGKIKYYHRDETIIKNGKYISDSSRSVAEALAQKEYEEQALAAAREELTYLKRALEAYPDETAEDKYDKLSTKRKELVVPTVKSARLFRDEWINAQFARKRSDNDGSELYTNKGEKVKSKSELIIANQLYTDGIPYRYECALELAGTGTIHPDFTILNVRTRQEIYWEHLGMMDNQEYIQKALRRIAAYEREGYYLGERLIVSWETSKISLSVRLVQMKIKEYFK